MTRLCVLILGIAPAMITGCGASQGDLEAKRATDEPLTDLAWLTGSWAGAENGVVSEEHWMSPRGKVMVGMNRVTGGEQDGSFEFLRIEAREDGVYYIANSAGRHPPTEFGLVDRGADYAAFENPLHDFPQQIRYARVGDTLKVSIAGERDGRREMLEWEWRRVH